jgi:hypothetical protein
MDPDPTPNPDPTPDPDPTLDPTPFYIDFKHAKKIFFFFIFFSHNLPTGSSSSV